MLAFLRPHSRSVGVVLTVLASFGILIFIALLWPTTVRAIAPYSGSPCLFRSVNCTNNNAVKFTKTTVKPATGDQPCDADCGFNPGDYVTFFLKLQNNNNNRAIPGHGPEAASIIFEDAMPAELEYIPNRDPVTGIRLLPNFTRQELAFYEQQTSDQKVLSAADQDNPSNRTIVNQSCAGLNPLTPNDPNTDRTSCFSVVDLPGGRQKLRLITNAATIPANATTSLYARLTFRVKTT